MRNEYTFETPFKILHSEELLWSESPPHILALNPNHKHLPPHPSTTLHFPAVPLGLGPLPAFPLLLGETFSFGCLGVCRPFGRKVYLHLPSMPDNLMIFKSHFPSHKIMNLRAAWHSDLYLSTRCLSAGFISQAQRFLKGEGKKHKH